MLHMPAALAYCLDLALLLANFAVSWLIARNSRRVLLRTGSPEKALYRVNMLVKYAGSLVLVATVGGIMFLTALQWGIALDTMGLIGKMVPLLLPLGIVMVISIVNQLILYPTLREIRQTTDTRKEQLGLLVRFLLLIVTPILLYKAVQLWLPDNFSDLISTNHIARLLFPAVFIVAINLATPLFLAKTLKASPMEEGELKSHLLSLAERNGIENPLLYTWPGRKNKTANALVSGFLKKRIFLTDYLMEHLDAEEIETIVAHEIGHIKKGHLWIRLGLILGWLVIIQLFAAIGDNLAQNVPDWVMLLVLGLLVIVYLGLTLMFIYRIQERQADAYSVQATGKPDALISALTKLSKLNHTLMKFNRADETFQSHPSIQRRIKWIAQHSNRHKIKKECQ